MSSLVLIRHGQASFLSKDYDKLSPLGADQARLLGEFWDRAGVGFDEIITGPRQRQRHTAQIAAGCFRAAGAQPPEIRDNPAFDEHQLEQLIREHRDRLPDPEWANAIESVPSPIERQRRFYHFLEAVAGLWLNADPATAGVEPWPAFKQRVLDALDSILDQAGRGRRIALFTSAGVIGVALQKALGCADLQAMRMSWRLRNASLTEFVFSRGRFTLDSFNGLPHLPDRGMWTHL